MQERIPLYLYHLCRWIGNITILLSVILFVSAAEAKAPRPQKGKKPAAAATRSKGKGKKQVVTASKGKKGKAYTATSGKKKGKRGKVAQASAKSKAPKAISHIVIADDSLVTDGIIYRKLDVTHTDSSKSIVHALTCVLRNPQYTVTTLKCCNRADGLERLSDLVNRMDSTENKKVVAAVNANFWRAVTNTAIGPTVANGEVVEMLPYRNWNSCFFDTKGRPVIDTFRLRGYVRTSAGQKMNIMSVNRRVAKDSLVMFNSFIGNSVPYVAVEQVERTVEEAVADSSAMTYDSTETAVNKDSLRQVLVQARQEANAEYPYAKVLLRYLRTPAVNQDMPLLVLGINDSGAVNMPLRGCILSLSKELLKGLNIVVGDTIYAKFSSNVHDTMPFTNAVCGTPRLIADGKIDERMLVIDNPNTRFVHHRLARTAVGTDITRSTLYVVTVEANARSRGFSIAEMAEFMKTFGAYNAINLDGGGSAQMALGSNMVTHLPESKPRRVAVALTMIKKKNISKPLSKQKGDEN